MIATLLSAGLAVAYATGFFYTSQAAIIGAGVVGFAAFFLPYLLRASGSLSNRLVLLGFTIAAVLFAAMIMNGASRAGGDVLTEAWRMISEAGWARYGLPAWGMLFGGSCLIGVVLPARQPAQNSR